LLRRGRVAAIHRSENLRHIGHGDYDTRNGNDSQEKSQTAQRGGF
jgi:hypothetical protein